MSYTRKLHMYNIFEHLLIREKQMIDWCVRPDAICWVPSRITSDWRSSVMQTWNPMKGIWTSCTNQNVGYLFMPWVYGMISCCFQCIICTNTTIIEVFRVNYVLSWIKVVPAMWYASFFLNADHMVMWHVIMWYAYGYHIMHTVCHSIWYDINHGIMYNDIHSKFPLWELVFLPMYSQNMCYLVQLGSINTDLPFKSPILKLILAEDFVFTDGFLPFLAFLISSLLVFKTFLKKIF